MWRWPLNYAHDLQIILPSFIDCGRTFLPQWSSNASVPRRLLKPGLGKHSDDNLWGHDRSFIPGNLENEAELTDESKHWISRLVWPFVWFDENSANNWFHLALPGKRTTFLLRKGDSGSTYKLASILLTYVSNVIDRRPQKNAVLCQEIASFFGRKS